jgi:hypothetical protein
MQLIYACPLSLLRCPICDPTELFAKCYNFPMLLAVVDICHRYQNVTELNLYGVMNAEALVMEAIMFLRSDLTQIFSPYLPHFSSYYCIFRIEFLLGI